MPRTMGCHKWWKNLGTIHPLGSHLGFWLYTIFYSHGLPETCCENPDSSIICGPWLEVVSCTISRNFAQPIKHHASDNAMIISEITFLKTSSGGLKKKSVKNEQVSGTGGFFSGFLLQIKLAVGVSMFFFLVSIFCWTWCCWFIFWQNEESLLQLAP